MKQVYPVGPGLLVCLLALVLLLPGYTAGAQSWHPRRSSLSASWTHNGQTGEDAYSLPSIQTHAGPLIFAAFSSSDVSRTAVQDELATRLRNDSLRAHNGAMIRGSIYSDFIFSLIQSYRLPRELIAVAYIESSFHARAESRTGALGIWQFAANSLAPWLEASESIPRWDERLDFWKASDAALQKLLQNFNATSNWLLAVAAYNGGLGRIRRSMELSGPRVWDLLVGEDDNQISIETAGYTPRFIASAFPALYPGRFGIKLDWDGAFVWKRLALPEGAELAEIAELTGVSLAILVEGNAEYLDGIIPPGGHYLKYPARYEDNFSVLKQEVSASTETDAVHMVQTGDTLWNISQRYGVSIDSLRLANNLNTDNHIVIGQNLRIPSTHADTDSSHESAQPD